ncbi:MAG: hypothetical protein M3521_09975 [Acidobacteriota bacterium]|jgi:hypothetical protein|nr:hypothetical protein [Acidobacteriota bacterium]MDQ3374199.1 hypothetical protein [Acidobacteriota bacterium]
MPTDLTQIVTEKMQVLPLEKQQRVLEFVESIERTNEPKKQSLLDRLEAISKRVPEEVWEKLPIDGAENIDHYLYGAPMK